MLLFDQNISPKIVRHLKSVFDTVEHVRKSGLEDASDREIFEFARSRNLAIVTFDADFADLSLVLGHPPKIIWLRTGNMSTLAVRHLLEKNAARIKNFISDSEDEFGVLEIQT